MSLIKFGRMFYYINLSVEELKFRIKEEVTYYHGEKIKRYYYLIYKKNIIKIVDNSNGFNKEIVLNGAGNDPFMIPITSITTVGDLGDILGWH